MAAGARCWAAIPAAGIGRRFASSTPKQYLTLHGRTLIEHALQPFLDHDGIAGVVVAIAADDPWWSRLPQPTRDRVAVVPGGEERLHSVLNCLRHLRVAGDADDWVLVHDAARPCLRMEDLDALMTRVAGHPVGGILALPVRDTMKRSDAGGDIEATVDRTNLWHALTPQMFRLGKLTGALEQAAARGTLVTDEAQAMELAGARPCLVPGHADNIKVTLPDDLAMAGLFLAGREEP